MDGEGVIQQPRMNVQETCKYLGISKRCWYQIENKPEPFRLGGKAFYTKEQIDKWFAECNREALQGGAQ